MAQTKEQKRRTAYYRCVNKLLMYPSKIHLAEAESLHRRLSHPDSSSHFGIEVNYTAGLLRRIAEERPDRAYRLIRADKMFERILDKTIPLMFNDFLEMVNSRDVVRWILDDERGSVTMGYENVLYSYLEKHVAWLDDPSITRHPRCISDQQYLSINNQEYSPIVVSTPIGVFTRTAPH